MKINQEYSLTPLQRIHDTEIAASGVNLYIKRDDLMHPYINGNKWRKLKYNLEAASNEGKKTILTFGGAYSNHIIATAAAGKEFNFNTIGIIRGEEQFPLNKALAFAKDNGMQLHYISREEYRKKNEPEFIGSLKNRFGDFYLTPEGGANTLGVKGCMEIVPEINTPFGYICCACGTGTTLAGVSLSLKDEQRALGFSALKGGEFLAEEVKQLASSFTNFNPGNFKIITDYHFGGYAKWNDELLNFINNFEARNRIPLEPVYTGKMLFGIYDLIKKGFFKKGETIVVVHTGGLVVRDE